MKSTFSLCILLSCVSNGYHASGQAIFRCELVFVIRLNGKSTIGLQLQDSLRMQLRREKKVNWWALVNQKRLKKIVSEKLRSLNQEIQSRINVSTGRICS